MPETRYHLLCAERTSFNIPERGLDDLPKNIFVKKVMIIKDLSTNDKEDLSGGLCDPDESISADKRAVRYCLDCQQKLCVVCFSWRSKFKHSDSHKSIGTP